MTHFIIQYLNALFINPCIILRKSIHSSFCLAISLIVKCGTINLISIFNLQFSNMGFKVHKLNIQQTISCFSFTCNKFTSKFLIIYCVLPEAKLYKDTIFTDILIRIMLEQTYHVNQFHVSIPHVFKLPRASKCQLLCQIVNQVRQFIKGLIKLLHLIEMKN